MFQRAALGLAILTALSGCDSRVSEAQDAVRAKLADPASAQFQKTETRPDKVGGTIVCGEVNSKNRMGGYAGFRRFFVQADIVRIEPEPGVQSDLIGQMQDGVAAMQFSNEYVAVCG